MHRNSLRFLLKVTLLRAGVLLLAAALLSPGRAVAQARQPSGQMAAFTEQIFTREDADLAITLHEAIRVALDESFDIFMLKEKYLQISYELEEARRRLRTRIDLVSTIPSISQEYKARWYTDRRGDELVYVKEGISYLYTALRVEQPLLTNGRITLGSRVLGYDHFIDQFTGILTEIRSVQPKMWLEYNQPLFQYNSIKGQLRDAELNLESLELSYTEAELQRINRVTRQFYLLFRSQRSLEVALETFLQSDINYRTALRKYEAGLAPELDQLSLDVTRANSSDRLVSALNNLERHQRDFNRRIGLPLDKRVWADANMEYRLIDVDMDRALQLAMKYRSDVRQVEIDLERSDLELRQIGAEGKPDLQLNFGYDLTGNSARSDLEASDGWSDHFGEAFNGDNWSPNTNVSLTLKVPIFDWGRNASSVNRQLSSIRVQQRELEEVRADLQRDVENRVLALKSAMRRMGIQEENRLVAQMNYDISQKRFEKGEISSTELIIAQQLYLDTETLLTSAFIEYETAMADLREITLWDWETNRSITQRTTPPKPFAER